MGALRRKRALTTAVAMSAALALGACCTDPVDGTRYFCLGSMSLEEELELGRSYAPIVDAQYDGVFADPEAQAYLGALVEEMGGASVYAGKLDWKFSILNTSIPNAFAVPGGYVYVTRGLLAAMETEGQFVSVMGHELGHVEHRHTHAQMSRQTLGALFVGLLGEVEKSARQASEPGVFTTLGELGTGLLLLRFSRSQELQADERGVYYAARLGYDPLEAVKTFEYFQRLEKSSGGASIAWLRTHPLNEDRIARIRAIVQERYPDLLDRPKESFRPYRDGNRTFEEIVARLRGVQPLYERFDEARALFTEAQKKEDREGIGQALQVFEELTRERPGEWLFWTYAGFARFLAGAREAARADLERAVALDESYLPERRYWLAHHLLGVVLLEEGEAEAAHGRLLAAHEAFPQHPAPVYHLGLSAEALGRTDEAREWYLRCIELEGDANGLYTKKAKDRLAALGS